MDQVALYGAGGFALQLIDTLEFYRDTLGRDVVIVTDEGGGELCGFPIIAEADVRDSQFAIAVANTGVRRGIAERLSKFITIQAETARISSFAQVSEGSIFAHHTIVEARAKIGRHFHANIYSYVAHECEIGDYVTFAPRVNCNGNVKIGDETYVGTGAFIRQGVTIGSRVTIGMGAVILRDIPDGATIVGVGQLIKLSPAATILANDKKRT
jgi:sugar O-acyltransferase (sialic acid O-acetyltransferase NeuD family)